MSLYNIYNICSSAPFPGIQILSALLCLSSIIQSCQCFKKNTVPQFFSDFLFSKFSLEKRKIFAILINFILIFTTIFGSNYFVVEVLGCDDIRAMPEGTYCYYVYATNEKGKTYTLPAKIYSYGEYQIENVYFKNGGYLYFAGTCYIEEYGNYSHATDQNENEWKIELTNRKAYHSMVDETAPYITPNDYACIVIVLLHIFMIVLHIFFWIKTNNSLGTA